MAQPTRSAGMEGQALLNVEGNLEPQLLGRNMNESTPLLQHDNAFIRVPVRISHAIVQAIAENAARLTSLLLLLVGMSLAFVAATSREFNPILVIAAAGMFILVGIITRLDRIRS